MMTISPLRSVGTRLFFKYSINRSPDVPPLYASYTALPSMRIEESIVVLFGVFRGVLSTTRHPPCERPYLRVKLILTPLSSRKTSFLQSRAAAFSFHSSRLPVTSGTLLFCGMKRLFLARKAKLDYTLANCFDTHC